MLNQRHASIPGFEVPLHRSLTEPILLAGAPRGIAILNGTLAAALGLGLQLWIAGLVVWDVKVKMVVEQHVVRRPVRFPYVPGLLSFREAPAILAVLRKMKSDPDAFLFDGQGLAHPRRFGLACHVGLLIDRPSLGCAKSLLIGTCDPPASSVGTTTPIRHHGECVGAVLRTRERVKPVYVSIGHRLSLTAAVRTVLAGCTRYRLPEPTRLADKLVAREKSSE